MALSRFTPWFAVSALMPLGSSSAHSLHLGFFFFLLLLFENINVTLRLFPFISIYPSFEVDAYISSADNACLFAAASSICRIQSEMVGNQMQLVHYLQIRRISATKAEI